MTLPQPGHTPSSSPIPTDIERVSHLADPVLRNLLITQRYHQLSLCLRRAIDPINVNWSTFATWASKTAGQSIRSEEVPRLVREVLFGASDLPERLSAINDVLRRVHPKAALGVPPLLAHVTETLHAVSGCIADGNLKVYSEIAPQFGRFLRAFRPGESYDPKRLDRYLAEFSEGPPEREGQTLLREAFMNYYLASMAQHPRRRAHLILLANCQVGLHEQTRLQSNIEDAMNTPIVDIFRARVTESVRGNVSMRVQGLIASALDAVLEPFLEDITRLWRNAATRFLMELALPAGRTMGLGNDVPVPTGRDTFFPTELQAIHEPGPLLELLDRFDRAPGDLPFGSAAKDWACLDDRMNFIVNLFRSRQHDVRLFNPPFSDEIVRAIESGRRPPPEALREDAGDR
jgi:hypothetical protein